eukprot:SM000001S04748  [mRNA]  locus=s1:1957100:1957589:+ [translate_table: standard]
MGAASEDGSVSQATEPAGQQRLSAAQFQQWKAAKVLTLIDRHGYPGVQDLRAQEAAEAAAKQRALDIAAGRIARNGRELFMHEPWVFDDSRWSD